MLNSYPKDKGRLPRSYYHLLHFDEPKMLCESPTTIYYGTRTVTRYVNILIDKWFKKILGAEKNKGTLIAILRELIPERTIVDISYGKKKRKNSPFLDCHDAVFDVECVDDSGARFVVEMQNSEQIHFHERALFYASFPIQEQVLARKKALEKKGLEEHGMSHDLEFDYPPVYVVSFLNFSFHEGDEQILYRYALRERKTGEMMTDRISFIFLEMKNAGEREPEEGDSFVRKLCWAFTHMTTLQERPASLMGEVFEKIFEACELSKMKPTDKTEYIMTTEMDRHDQYVTAFIRGEEKGLQQGRAEGEAKGRAEAAKLICEKLGLPSEKVAEILGLRPPTE